MMFIGTCVPSLDVANSRTTSVSLKSTAAAFDSAIGCDLLVAASKRDQAGGEDRSRLKHQHIVCSMPTSASTETMAASGISPFGCPSASNTPELQTGRLQ